MSKRSIFVPAALLAAVVVALVALGWLAGAVRIPTPTVERTRAQVGTPTTADPPGIFADEPVADCSTVQLPGGGAEINTVLDYYSKKLLVSFLDPQLGEDRKILINYEDPACEQNPQIRMVIRGALKAHAQSVAEDCRSMAEIVRSGKPEVGGHPIDLEAAKRFLERWCK